MTATGTVYALIDPRSGSILYIGQTIRTLPERLSVKYAARVISWMAGLRPEIIALRENVATDELLSAEAEEITRIIAAGGTLLNEQVTARGRKLLSERRAAEREAAECSAWAEVADAALAIIGGPMPPGEFPLIEIPDAAWRFVSTSGPARMEHANSLLRSVSWREVTAEHHALQRAAEREQDEAIDQLLNCAQYAWGNAYRAGGDSFGRRVERNVSDVLHARCADREDASRFLALAVWCAVAVYPWRHLAELAGLPLDDTSFTAWAGRDDQVREALTFLTSCGGGAIERLSRGEHSPQLEKAPGRMLGAVAAAYSDTEPAEAIRSDLAETLGGLADYHMLTQPMADLLMRLNPRALDAIFGKDVAAQMDHDLGLTAGTSGRVLRAFVGRHPHSNDPAVRRAADRSAQALPVTALPECGGWSGLGIPALRSVSGCLVRAGLAEPDRMSTEEYLAEVRAIWTPRLDRQREQAA